MYKCLQEDYNFYENDAAATATGGIGVHENDLPGIKTKRKRYACDQCDKSYIESQSLKSHKKLIHEGYDEHACVHCDKRFRYAKRLERHLRSHTQGNPFECYQCRKTFTKFQNLREHFNTHTGLILIR